MRVRASLRRALVALACAAIALLFATPSFAHAVGLSKGDYVVTGRDVVAEITLARPEVVYAVPTLDANGDGTVDDAELAQGRASLASTILGGVVVHGDGAVCTPSFESAQLTEQDGVVVRARYQCPSPPQTVSVVLTLLESLSHGHRHLARAQIGAVTTDDVLYRGHEEITVHAGATASESAPSPSRRLGFFAFLRMGIEHILTGYDHLVFLFGLILVGGRVRALIGVVTAFTIAHSITLALAALNIWSPPSRVVEAGIALSIVYVGVENFFVKNAERRWRITFPFGLVHGFGFASALREIDLSRSQVPAALVSFNVGVEIGQLAVMAVALPLVLWLRKKKWLDERRTRVLSACVIAAGAFWFVMRVTRPT